MSTIISLPSLPVASVLLLLSVAAPQALCKNHQPGCEQEEQEGNGEEGGAGEGEARSGEYEEEQTTCYQVSIKKNTFLFLTCFCSWSS